MIKLIYLSLTKKEKLKFFVLFLFSLLENILEIIVIAFIPTLFLLIQDKVSFLNFLEEKNIFLFTKLTANYSHSQLIIYFFLLFILFFLIRAGIKILNAFMTNRFIGQLTSEKINNTINIFFSLPFEINQRYKISDLQLLLENIEFINRSIVLLINLTKEIIILLFLFILIFYEAPYVALVILVFAIFFIGIFKILQGQVFFDLGKYTRFSRLIFYDNIKEGIVGLKEILIFGKLDFLLTNFKKNNVKLFSYKYKFEFLSSIIRPAIELGALCLVIVSLVIINIFSTKSLAVNSAFLILLTICLLRTMPAISTITGSILSLINSQGTVEKTFQDISDLEQIYMSQNYKKVFNSKFKNQIKLVNCSYKYKNTDQLTLKNINLEISRGEKIAFFGKTGCGKTSLVNLIVGLIEPSNGHVFLDNKERKNEMINPGFVPQNIHLFNNSIAANISLKQSNDESELNYINKIIDVCQLRDFVNNKKNKIEYIINDNGKDLSGGEKQRIGLARALFHNADFLILDEATTGLDKLVERKVLDKIIKFNPDLTLIIISHEPKNLFICDKIYTMENGMITGCRKPNEIVSY
jgi:ABC-type transport system involved in cytochrome bd biosynthesis fused ATPase/permease subunit